MDATDFDKMADKIMVFRGKLPKLYDLQSPYAYARVNDMLNLIEQMLTEIDILSEVYDKGWIK